MNILVLCQQIRVTTNSVHGRVGYELSCVWHTALQSASWQVTVSVSFLSGHVRWVSISCRALLRTTVGAAQLLGHHVGPSGELLYRSEWDKLRLLTVVEDLKFETLLTLNSKYISSWVGRKTDNCMLHCKIGEPCKCLPVAAYCVLLTCGGKWKEGEVRCWC